MDQQQSSDIPEELQKSRETKEANAAVAQMEVENKVSKSEAFFTAIGYISFLCILPLVLFRESKFAQYHGKQALVLAIFLYFFDILQIFPARFSAMYMVIKVILVIYCMIKCYRGQYFKIPFIYDLSQRFRIDITEKK